MMKERAERNENEEFEEYDGVGEACTEELERETVRSRFTVLRDRILARETVLLLSKGIGLLALAFLFDRCEWLLSVRPFGIALLCAAESGLLWIFGGLVLAALPVFGGTFRAISVAICVAAVLLRVAVRMTVDLPWKRGGEPTIRTFGAFRKALFREHISLRMTVSATAAFLYGLYGMIAGGYQVYDLFSALILILLSPLCVLLLSALWRRGVFGMRTFRELCSVCGFFALLVLSLREMTFYRISLAVFTALFCTLWLAYRKGIAVGILAGLLLGVAVDPIAAPLYAFAAISAGALKRVSMFMGALSALSVGMAWGFYVYGLGALSGLLPGLLAASLLFCVFERLGVFGERTVMGAMENVVTIPDKSEVPDEPKTDYCAEERRAEEERLSILRSSLDAERLRDEERKIEDLCGAFLSVSELLRALRESSKYPSVEEFRRVCDRVYDEFCPGCASCNLCWGSEYARMAGTLGHMAEELREKGCVSPDVLPEEVRERCKMSGVLFLRINEEASTLTAETLKREKAGLLSADYSAAASLFRSASRGRPEDYGIDEERSRAAERALIENGVYPSRVAVSCGRRGGLFAWNVERAAVERLFASASRRESLADAIGFCPGDPVLTEIPGGGGMCDLRLSATPKYTLKSAYVSRSARHGTREERLCGDSVALFDGGDGRSFALLSDGMGSGREAAHLSGICTVFLQKMLASGGETEVILRMLNDFLVAGTAGETSATVDLLEFDLYTGEAVFWKSGAAPTFILREGNLLRLSSRTAPAGILPEMDVQKTVFRLYSDDVVVMVSDGIADDGDACDALELLLGGIDAEDGLLHAAERIADSRRIAATGGEERTDDRSVILLRVENCADDGEEVLAAG